MPLTHTPIATTTVGSGGASSIDFTSISGSYTDLIVKISARSATAGTSQDDVNVTFNGSTSSYTWRNVLGNGTVGGSAISQNGSTAYIRMSAFAPNAGTTASTFGYGEIYIPNYADSKNKAISINMASEQDGQGNYMGIVAGLWSNTAAITQVTLTGASSAFAQYTTATLYGIKKD